VIQIIIITEGDKILDMIVPVCAFMHMQSDIGRSENVTQLFDICIKLIISIYILKSPEINITQLLVTDSENSLMKHAAFK